MMYLGPVVIKILIDNMAKIKKSVLLKNITEMDLNPQSSYHTQL